MAGELTIPILMCVPFYEVLGFQVTCRQARPNPYAAVRREDIQLHFYEPEGFDPQRSYGSAIVVVPDAAALYRAFARRIAGGVREALLRDPTHPAPAPDAGSRRRLQRRGSGWKLAADLPFR